MHKCRGGVSRVRKHHCVADAMASTVVLVILLDTLPDFPVVLNQTFHKLSKYHPNVSLHHCDPTITKAVINKAKYGIANDPIWKANKEFGSPNNYLDKKDDITDRVPTENYPELDEFYSIENADNFIDLNELERGDEDDVIDSKNVLGKLNTTIIKKSAPYLVAIFETLSNVTAQTCAGTLLSPQWVVTVASCLNVLRDLYNMTYTTDRSLYTVVAESTNPFIDGSVHNVTQVLQPDRLYDLKNDTVKHPDHVPFHKLVNSSSLVLMRLDPEVSVGGMTVWEHPEAEPGLDVEVYGWKLMKNDSLYELRMISTPAKVAALTKCHSSLSAMCLVLDGGAKNTQIWSGGPVVALTGPSKRARVLGVALGGSPALAAPLAGVLSWLEQASSVNSTL